MYVVAAKAKLEGKYFGVMNTLPDGRVYIPINEMRNVGTLSGVDIIGSGRELTALIKAQQDAMEQAEQIDPEFGIHPQSEDIDPEFSREPEPEPQPAGSGEMNMVKNKKGGKQ